MQISLGSKGDYSVRAVLDLARSYGDGRRKAREIAAAMDIPEKYVAQVLADLVREGIVLSTAGPGGGYRLSRPPDRVSLLEVVDAAEGIKHDRCIMSGGPCHWDHACAVHPAWSRAQEAFEAELGKTTFDDLVGADRFLQEGGTLQRP
jgi:Rrf2 family transcriptional regulator, iron-sulfur cluster assembly transcription factor